MNKDLIYNSDCLTTFLCDDIIELSNIDNLKEFVIPKEDTKWRDIEKILYTELLTHLKKYSNELILLNSHDGNNMIQQLSKKLYTKDFKITMNKILNRFNVISYLFCIYDTITIHDIKFNDVKGKLFLFPEQYKINTNQPIGIYGQLCYENVV